MLEKKSGIVGPGTKEQQVNQKPPKFVGTKEEVCRGKGENQKEGKEGGKPDDPEHKKKKKKER